ALVRWRDEGGTLIAPSGFIRPAEDAGLIDAIDDWVLDEVLRQASSWRSEGVQPAGFSVNLSVERCRRADPAPRMLARVQDAGFDPGIVTVEVADSPLLADRGTIRTIEGLRTGGFRVAVDDFGTGSSSLALPRQVQVDALKI